MMINKDDKIMMIIKENKMIMGRKNELLCSKCRKRVSYKIFKRPVKVKIKDMELEYEEYYGICDNCSTSPEAACHTACRRRAFLHKARRPL